MDPEVVKVPPLTVMFPPGKLFGLLEMVTLPPFEVAATALLPDGFRLSVVVPVPEMTRRTASPSGLLMMPELICQVPPL